MSQYNLRTRAAMTASIHFPNVSPPKANTITLNFDVNGQSLTYKNAKAGPDREQ